MGHLAAARGDDLTTQDLATQGRAQPHQFLGGGGDGSSYLKSRDNYREHKACFPKGNDKLIFLACAPSRCSPSVRLNKQVSHSKENK